jgi:diamine N-acetyltransferase
MFIKGEDIALRAMEPADVELLYNWENRRDLWAVSYTQTPFSKSVLNDFVNASHQDIYTIRQLRVMIVELASKETIGTIDWYEFEPQHQRVGLGIFVHENFRRKGYAAEAINLCKDYAFNTLHLRQIYASVGARNEASIKLFLSCGFEKAGVKKDWNRIGVTVYEDVWFLQFIFNG